MKKKIAKSVLSLICATSLILSCAEYPDGSVGAWNFICLAITGLSGWGLNRLLEEEA